MGPQGQDGAVGKWDGLAWPLCLWSRLNQALGQALGTLDLQNFRMVGNRRETNDCVTGG